MMDVDGMNNNHVAGLASSFDSNLFHQVTVTDLYARNSSTFTVPRRYTQLQFISAGAQGTVASALDLVTGEKVAIKKMQQPFVTPMNAKRAYREFVLLTSIKHPNIIRLLNAFTPQTRRENFNEVYLVMELMHFNLHEVSRRVRFDHRRLSFFVYQMLVGIRHLHNASIIHRDLKPSNIVANEQCVLKILDFGLARKRTFNSDVRMSDYVVTRYYRAPEVILGLPYDEKVDVWSVGCIFAELINQSVLFPGTDRIDQWSRIVNVLGTPHDHFISRFAFSNLSSRRLGSSAGAYVRSMPRRMAVPFAQVIPDKNFLADSENERAGFTAAVARDLLEKMLKIDPEDRSSVDECINHPYVRIWIRDEESENRYDPDIDFAEKTLSEWKDLIFDEVERFQREHDVFGPPIQQTSTVL